MHLGKLISIYYSAKKIDEKFATVTFGTLVSITLRNSRTKV